MVAARPALRTLPRTAAGTGAHGGEASRSAGDPAAATAVHAALRRRTLTDATVDAARRLGLTQAELARVLGVSAATVSRMAQRSYALDEAGKAWQLAALLVRLYRSLDSIVGGDAQALRAWFDSENRALNGVPRARIGDVQGLTDVVRYLDAARARI